VILIPLTAPSSCGHSAALPPGEREDLPEVFRVPPQAARTERPRQETDRSQLRAPLRLPVRPALSKVIVITAFAILISRQRPHSSPALRQTPLLHQVLEGSSAFFVSALLVVAVAPKIAYAPVEYLVGAVTAAVATVVEAAGIKVDDNLSIPSSAAR